MALQWYLLGVVAGVEAAVLLLLSAPLPRGVAKQILGFVKGILQPGLAVVPFALFQLLGISHHLLLDPRLLDLAPTVKLFSTLDSFLLARVARF